MGGQNFKMKFLSLARAGGPHLKKVDKIYTRGENFSKKGHFDKIFGILPNWGVHAPPLATGLDDITSGCLPLDASAELSPGSAMRSNN